MQNTFWEPLLYRNEWLNLLYWEFFWYYAYFPYAICKFCFLKPPADQCKQWSLEPTFILIEQYTDIMFYDRMCMFMYVNSFQVLFSSSFKL